MFDLFVYYLCLLLILAVRFVGVFFLFDFCVTCAYRLWPRVILVLSASRSASERSRHQAVWFDRRQSNAAGTVPTLCKGARSIQSLND